MDELHYQHQSIETRFQNNSNDQPSMSKIDAWERKSIRKIQEMAEAARHDLRQQIDRTRVEVQQRLKTIDSEFQMHEYSDNFTEIDLRRWTKQLNELKDLLETPPKISVIEEKNSSSSVGTLQVLPLPSPREQFLPVFGPCRLSADRLVVTQGDYRAGLSQLTGQGEYSSGRHSIEFLLENKGRKNLFIGVRSPHARADPNNIDASVHGWWNLDHLIINGESQSGRSNDGLQTGDAVRLILDCDQRHISLEHDRTNQSFTLPIRLDQCPFPWKILVRLLTTDDRLRIIG